MIPEDLQARLTQWYGDYGKLLYYNEEGNMLWRCWTCSVLITHSDGENKISFCRIFGCVGEEMQISIDREIPVSKLDEAVEAVDQCAKWKPYEEDMADGSFGTVSDKRIPVTIGKGRPAF